MNHHNHDIEKAVLGRIIYDGDYLKICDVLEARQVTKKLVRWTPLATPSWTQKSIKN